MIDIIKNIFTQSGFKFQKSDNFYLFSFEKKISYWIVKECESLDFLKTQDELFNAAKLLTEHDPAFDKNASLLLLYIRLYSISIFVFHLFFMYCILL